MSQYQNAPLQYATHGQNSYHAPPQYTSNGQNGYHAPPQYIPNGQNGYHAPPQYIPNGQNGYYAPPQYTSNVQSGCYTSPQMVYDNSKCSPAMYPHTPSCAAEERPAGKNWFKISAGLIFRIVFLFFYFVGLLVSIISGIACLVLFIDECDYSFETLLNDHEYSDFPIIFAISIAVTAVSYVLGTCCAS